MMAAALRYLAAGASVIPVRRDKRPCVPWRAYQDRPATEAEVRDWWRTFPSAGIGIVCGQVSGVTVLDVEVDALWALDGLSTPETAHCETQSGGRHFYFGYDASLPSTTWRQNGQHLGELRNDGNYVVAPPSPGYRWLTRPDEQPLLAGPDWLRDLGRGQITRKGRRSMRTTAPRTSRSEADQTTALHLVLAGADDRAIAEELRKQESYRDRGAHGEAYVERTIMKARGFAAAHYFLARICHVAEKRDGVWLTFEVLEGPHVGRRLRLRVPACEPGAEHPFWCSLRAALGKAPRSPALLWGTELRIGVGAGARPGGLTVWPRVFAPSGPDVGIKFDHIGAASRG